jgi:hypothetical protein
VKRYSLVSVEVSFCVALTQLAAQCYTPQHVAVTRNETPTIRVRILLYMCPPTDICVSSYHAAQCYTPQDVAVTPKRLLYVSAYYYICVLLLIYMCPHTTRRSATHRSMSPLPETPTIRVGILLYVSSCYYICVRILLYVSSYYYIRVLLLIYVSSYHAAQCYTPQDVAVIMNALAHHAMRDVPLTRHLASAWAAATAPATGPPPAAYYCTCVLILLYMCPH